MPVPRRLRPERQYLAGGGQLSAGGAARGGDRWRRWGPEEDGADTEAPQYTDNFSIDTEAVTAFAEQIQAAVAEKNLEALADLASYPLYIGFSDGGESVESREDLIALEADRIFSEELVSEIAGADPGGLAPSKAGFALSASGRPNVVFSVVDGRLAIVGINY